jgi:hypothetical protein
MVNGGYASNKIKIRKDQALMTDLSGQFYE